MTGRRRNAILAMIFGYLGLLISLARNVFFVPIYLRDIPFDEYGAWLATGGALALILINDYGLAGVVTQRLSARFGAGDLASLGRLTGSALLIGTLMAIGLSAVSLLLLPFLPGLTTLNQSSSQTVLNCFIAAIVANAFGVIGGTATSVLRSLQQSMLSGSIVLLSEFANVVVILVGLHAGYGLYAIAAGLLIRAILLSAASLVAVWWVHAREVASRIEFNSAELRDLGSEASRFFLSSIAMKLQSQANVFFVGSILGPASAAIYSLTVRAHETVAMVISLINGSLVPSVTHLLGSGNIQRFRTVLLRLVLSLGAITALAMTMTIVLNADFLKLWVGRYAFGGQLVSIAMAAALFVSSIGYIAYDALLAQGRFRTVSRAFVATSMLQVILLASFLHFGLWVAPTATMLTAAVWGSAFWIGVSQDITLTRSESRGIAMDLLRVLGVSAIVTIAFFALHPNVNSWLALIAQGIACCCVLTIGYLATSSKLRKILFEEIGTTLRIFREA